MGTLTAPRGTGERTKSYERNLIKRAQAFLLTKRPRRTAEKWLDWAVELVDLTEKQAYALLPTPLTRVGWLTSNSCTDANYHTYKRAVKVIKHAETLGFNPEVLSRTPCWPLGRLSALIHGPDQEFKTALRKVLKATPPQS